MAYVRKVRTTSGAVAVQVARKDHGRVVILAHLGSAHTDAELGILLEQAREMVVGGQAALDFEVAARAQSVADVPDFREQALIAGPAEPAVAAPAGPVAVGRPVYANRAPVKRQRVVVQHRSRGTSGAYAQFGGFGGFPFFGMR